ncbi:hypothetical protein N9Q51_02990 [Flavobacteriaceae bacterium]|nr:hypothetical protein [Flavobacteriaceae bacterium]|tara:strand:+ start:183 stop:758 length:576 start_codon:yes stop_codon:yes gene_type:complete
MKNEIYSLWYKHPSQLINTPLMSLMVRKEGIESYGLYMHLADTLHLVGGFQEYDFNDICLMLGYTKKNIKAKLGRVINDYKLFDFYTNDDGIEMIGLERLKEDIEALSKHKINGAKGGKKRAENYRNKKEGIKNKQVGDKIKLPESFLNKSIQEQENLVRYWESNGSFSKDGERGIMTRKLMIEHIQNQKS